MERSDRDLTLLEQLLQTKPFGKLSSGERELVLRFFDSEAEYESIRHHTSHVEGVLSADTLSVEPDPAIELRLQQTLSMQPQPEPKVATQSSFGSLLVFLFSSKHLAFKTSLLTIAFISTFWVSMPTGQRGSIPPIDSTSYHADTFNNTWYDSSSVSIDFLQR